MRLIQRTSEESVRFPFRQRDVTKTMMMNGTANRVALLSVGESTYDHVFEIYLFVC